MLSTQELGTVSGTELVVMAVMKQGKGTENGERGSSRRKPLRRYSVGAETGRTEGARPSKVQSGDHKGREALRRGPM